MKKSSKSATRIIVPGPVEVVDEDGRGSAKDPLGLKKKKDGARAGEDWEALPPDWVDWRSSWA